MLQEAIQQLQAEGKKVTQQALANITPLGMATIKRHLAEIRKEEQPAITEEELLESIEPGEWWAFEEDTQPPVSGYFVNRAWGPRKEKKEKKTYSYKGPSTGAILKNRTRVAMLEAIEQLEKEGQEVTPQTVAQLAGRAEKTAKKHWVAVTGEQAPATKKESIQQAQKAAAYASADKKAANTLAQIIAAIQALLAANKKVTQQAVAEATGRGIATIKRNWTKQEIQQALTQPAPMAPAPKDVAAPALPAKNAQGVEFLEIEGELLAVYGSTAADVSAYRNDPGYLAGLDFLTLLEIQEAAA
ncbi:hypothetical protein [Cesiribacter andamanensis]|nr:hypothetical protein [Cesiribacter andamanensis]